MANRRVSKKDTIWGGNSKRVIFWRTVILMCLCGVVLFVPLFAKLWDVAIVHHEDYQQRAAGQQTLDLAVSASRGNIYDCNGNLLAMSATVYNLILSPRDLEASVKQADYTDTKGEPDAQARAAAVEAKQRQVVSDLLALLPELDREKVESQVQATRYAYREVAKNLEEETAQKIREYIVENKTSSYLYLVAGTQRYYPYASLASQMLGFVNAEGGAVGLEAAYDDVLEGTSGRVVTTKTGKGVQMYNSYSQFIDAIDGYHLQLTMDAAIQSYAEKALEEGIKNYAAQAGGFCVVMDPKTGAIKAMASSPEFDPNNYSKIVDALLDAQMEEQAEALFAQLKQSSDGSKTEEELLKQAQDKAYSDAVNTQWRSKALDSRYEPGSTFKALVLAAALEEGLVSEKDTFTCTGSYTVAGWPHPISCSKKTGHGVQTLAQAVQNSCNPAFMQIGQRLGIETFYDYFEAFGLKEKTGIDLPGESDLKGAVWAREEMSGVDLAVASFGQRFEITPVQMITAFAATINGGYLMQPYVVQSVTDQDGTVVQNTQPAVVRQVVSRETSRRTTEILESVVAQGTGKNAYVAGYRIGGKTGTTEVKNTGEVIVSFMGFAPADDPEVLVLLAFDSPERSSTNSDLSTTGVFISGGNMAAKAAGALMEDILDYMGVEKQYTPEESAAVDVVTPAITGSTVSDAAAALKKHNLKYRTVGQGDTVTTQIPAAGTNVPGGSTVILYLGESAPEENAQVPNVEGLSYEAARSRLEQAGFFMRASGVSVYFSNSTTAATQSIPGGEVAAIGTVVDVRFSNVVEDGWVDAG